MVTCKWQLHVRNDSVLLLNGHVVIACHTWVSLTTTLLGYLLAHLGGRHLEHVRVQGA